MRERESDDTTVYFIVPYVAKIMQNRQQMGEVPNMEHSSNDSGRIKRKNTACGLLRFHRCTKYHTQISLGSSLVLHGEKPEN